MRIIKTSKKAVTFVLNGSTALKRNLDKLQQKFQLYFIFYKLNIYQTLKEWTLNNTAMLFENKRNSIIENNLFFCIFHGFPFLKKTPKVFQILK